MTSSIVTLVGEDRVCLPVPSSIVGKRVKVSFTVLDEPEIPKLQQVKKLSEMLRSALSKKSTESFLEHVKTMREEWDT